jgi:hypothetical protein
VGIAAGPGLDPYRSSAADPQETLDDRPRPAEDSCLQPAVRIPQAPGWQLPTSRPFQGRQLMRGIAGRTQQLRRYLRLNRSLLVFLGLARCAQRSSPAAMAQLKPRSQRWEVLLNFIRVKPCLDQPSPEQRGSHLPFLDSINRGSPGLESSPARRVDLVTQADRPTSCSLGYGGGCRCRPSALLWGEKGAEHQP